MLQIKRVDARHDKTVALLNWLQLEILPSDNPDDVSVGNWWVDGRTTGKRNHLSQDLWSSRKNYRDSRNVGKLIF